MAQDDDPAVAFDAFRDEVLSSERIAELATAAQVDAEWLESTLAVSLGESDYTMRWLAPWLEDGPRILEVGAGLGLTSAYLASNGFEICSLEPGGLGFERYERVNPLLRASLGIAHPHLSVSIEDVTAEHAGTFDLIFSNNVLEHVRDVDTALATLGALLRPGGVMVHNCPNYTVPYEPHFGIPLLPLRPASTARVLPSSITSTGLWQSINFVTARDVRRVADRHGATVHRPVARAGVRRTPSCPRPVGSCPGPVDACSAPTSARVVHADDRVVAQRRHDRVGVNAGQPGGSAVSQLPSETHGATVSTITYSRNRPGVPTSKRRSPYSSRCSASEARSG